MRAGRCLIIIGVIVSLAAVIALIFLVIRFYGTGFNGYTIITTTQSIKGISPPTITRTVANQPGKTLWDWMQLLIIPIVLAVAGYVINLTISRGERDATNQRDKTEREIALDNQHEAALQKYIDKMAELLLEKNLRDSTEEDEVRKIARVRTLTVLRRLDAERKRSVLQFLYESGLIVKGSCIVDLGGANLRGANLGRAILHFADLRFVKLSGAFLNFADLSEADLSGADLDGADLSGANLKGATMPNGSIHP